MAWRAGMGAESHAFGPLATLGQEGETRWLPHWPTTISISHNLGQHKCSYNNSNQGNDSADTHESTWPRQFLQCACRF